MVARPQGAYHLRNARVGPRRGRCHAALAVRPRAVVRARARSQPSTRARRGVDDGHVSPLGSKAVATRTGEVARAAAPMRARDGRAKGCRRSGRGHAVSFAMDDALVDRYGRWVLHPSHCRRHGPPRRPEFNSC